MSAHANRHSPVAGDSPAARYRRALETAAWARAEFTHPSAARDRVLTPATPPTRTLIAERSPRRGHGRALAIHGLMCASFALVAFGAYLR